MQGDRKTAPNSEPGHYLSYFALLAFGVWSVVLFFKPLLHPPVGTFIAMLAFLACIVTIWPPDSRWFKAAWLAVFLLLLILELRTLYQQKADDQQTELSKTQAENNRFDGLLTTQRREFAEVLSQNQRQFKTTLERSAGIFSKVEETLAFTSGGDTFPVVQAASDSAADGSQQISFHMFLQGGYPLYGLSVSVGRAYRSKDEPTQIRTYGVSAHQDEVRPGYGGKFIGSTPVPADSPAYYSAAMAARNGQWEETIEARRVEKGFAFRWVVYGSNRVGSALVWEPYKKLLDLADENFPLAARKATIYPLDVRILPVESVTSPVR